MAFTLRTYLYYYLLPKIIKSKQKEEFSIDREPEIFKRKFKKLKKLHYQNESV